MQIIYGLHQVPESPFAVVTAGSFDGVHLGHQKLLDRLIAFAKEKGGHSYLITFDPHPRLVLNPDYAGLRILSTLQEKQEALAASGLDYLVVVPFTRAFSLLSGEDYVKQVLVDGVKARHFVIGYDHKFGHNRDCGIDYLKSTAQYWGFDVEEIAREDIDAMGVSSTRIRKALESHDIPLATSLLGRHYTLRGVVVKGKQLGRTIGYPTANIDISSPHKLIPADGIYAVFAHIIHPNGEKSSRLSGMMSIGHNPTVQGTHRTIEVYLFDFSADLYGSTLEVHFAHYLRAEAKFDGLSALKAALEQDERVSRRLLSDKA